MEARVVIGRFGPAFRAKITRQNHELSDEIWQAHPQGSLGRSFVAEEEILVFVALHVYASRLPHPLESARIRNRADEPSLAFHPEKEGR